MIYRRRPASRPQSPRRRADGGKRTRSTIGNRAIANCTIAVVVAAAAAAAAAADEVDAGGADGLAAAVSAVGARDASPLSHPPRRPRPYLCRRLHHRRLLRLRRLLLRRLRCCRGGSSTGGEKPVGVVGGAAGRPRLGGAWDAAVPTDWRRQAKR